MTVFPVPIIFGGRGGKHWTAAQAAYRNSLKASRAGYSRTSFPTTAWHTLNAGAISYVTNPNSAPLEDAGIRAGEIVGWRLWLVEDGPEGFQLRSTYMPTPWKPGVPMTGDIAEYGVHAWKTKNDAMLYLYESGVIMTGFVVLGQVELWGKVIEHENGYRAEYAAVLSLDQDLSSYDWPERLTVLRQRYLGA